MRKLSFLAALLAFCFGSWAIGTKLLAQSGSNNSVAPLVTIVDNCLASDPGWAPTGGCLNKPHQGDVSFAEFNALLFSPLSVTTVGHPAWRNDPSYISIRAGQNVLVSNKGGRGHTFTEVIEYGGGFIPPLNGTGIPGKTALIPAATCLPAPASGIIAPGDSIVVAGLSPGLHRFQCCIHPWMHAAIRVD